MIDDFTPEEPNFKDTERINIEKEMETVDKMKRLEDSVIPENYDYKKIKSLSAEALEKLSAIRPKSIGQASRISGVSPSDVSILMVHMKK